MKAKTRLILSKITFVLFIIFWQVETWFFTCILKRTSKGFNTAKTQVY